MPSQGLIFLLKTQSPHPPIFIRMQIMQCLSINCLAILQISGSSSFRSTTFSATEDYCVRPDDIIAQYSNIEIGKCSLGCLLSADCGAFSYLHNNRTCRLARFLIEPELAGDIDCASATDEVIYKLGIILHLDFRGLP